MMSGTIAWPMLIAAAALLVVWRRSRAAALAERVSRPRELLAAELVYRETLFRIRSPIRLVAKVDRVYRLPSGALVLVELKTRLRNQPYLTDIIQLSAQKLAIEGQTGDVVEPYAFVSILGIGKRGPLRSHRVGAQR